MAAVANVAINVDSRGANKKLDDLGRKAKRTETAFGNLSSVVTKLGGALAGIQAAKFVIAKTSELERQTRSLQVLTGSLEQAKNVIRELQQFGAVTPFTSAELIETAKRLKAFGFETQNIVDVTKRLSDIAGATGADLGGIATAFGQIQAKGRLQGEELLQLQERGVDLQGTLRKEYGLTADEFQKALSKGQIGADAVNHALVKLTETGGKYAGGAISQSDTLAGRFSTLQDGIDNIARKIGEVLAPALKSVLDLAIDTVNNINAAFAAGSITDTQKQGFKQLAEEEVKRFAGPLPGGPFGAGEIVVRTNGKTYKGAASSVVSQITNDLINAEIERLTQASAPKISKSNIQTSIPALGAGTNGGTSSSGKSAADKLEQQLAIGKEIRVQQQRRNQLLNASSSLQQSLLQIEFNRLDAIKRIQETAAASQQQELIASANKNAEIEKLKEIERFAESELKAADDLIKATYGQIEAEKRREELISEGIDPALADELVKIEQTFDAVKEKLDLRVLDLEAQLATVQATSEEAKKLQEVIDKIKEKQRLELGPAEEAAKDNAKGKSEEDKAKEKAEKLQKIMEDLRDNAIATVAGALEDALVTTIEKAITGAEDLGESLKALASGVLKDLGRMFIRAGISGLGGSMGIPGFANGGPVQPNGTYLVGERGPELLSIGNQSGYVHRNTSEAMDRYRAGGSSDGGSRSLNVNYNVTQINGMNFVTEEQFRAGMTKAAKDGAKMGEAGTFKSMRNSRSSRARVGL